MNFSASSALNSDSPTDAFGNNDGPNGFENGNFLFDDLAGGLDNGNGTFDPGERIDSISWQTTSPINLAGFELNLGGEASGNRGAELVRFFVGGVQQDLFDANGMNFTMSRLFAGGPVIGNDFRIEFTRTALQGPRIREINAILAIAVPEPASMSLLALGGMALMRRRRMA